MKTRAQVIQGLLDRYESPNYLEIGVNKGHTFHSLKASRKVAVDPKFVFRESEREKGEVYYYEITSDEYFGGLTNEAAFQVIYLDGLHTFEQTLRDLISATTCLTDDGVIVIDDVVPNSFHAALPDLESARMVGRFVGSEDASWMGDVYKLVFFVQTFFQRFSYATIADNHGQMIMWREARPSVAQRDILAFSLLSFADVVRSRDCFRIQPFETVVETLRATGRARL